MSIDKVTDILILILCLLGIGCLYETDSVNTVYFIIFILATIPTLYKILRDKDYFVSTHISNLIALVIVFFLLAEIFLLGSEIVFSLINFLVLITSLKLGSQKKIRDYQQILLLSFFQILAASVLTTKFIFGVFLLLYFIAGILTVMVLNIKKERENAYNEVNNRFDLFSLLKFELIIVFIVLISSISFFLILPRFSVGFLSGIIEKPNSIKSGFSEKVELGKVGEIKSDNSPVMRVKILNRPEKKLDKILYWRGLALDKFDGISWSVSDRSSYSVKKKNRNKQIVVDQKYMSENLLDQEIITEPIDTRILFTADKPVMFSEIPNSKVSSLNDSYFVVGARNNRIKYLASSNITEPAPDILNSVEWESTSALGPVYTEKTETSKQFNDLVGELFDESKTYYENVINVRNHILQNYNYTRTLSSSNELFPIDDFLFKYKEGHCEYFASAMVLILRTMDIPARIVTGFLGGEYNSYGNFYLIRESNAHAWVEVYFPSFGWIRFDPTPEGSSQFQNKKVFALLSILDFLKYRWSRYVIDFTSRDQLNILKSLNKEVRDTSVDLKKLNDLRKINRNYFGLSLLIIIFLIIFYRHKDIFRIFTASKSEKASSIYLNILKLLQKYDIKKSFYLTHDEFLNLVISDDDNFNTVFRDFTDTYQQLRFSNKGTFKLKDRLYESADTIKKLLSENKNKDDYIRHN